MTISVLLIMAGLSGDVRLNDHLPSGVWLLDDGALAQSPPPLPQRADESPPAMLSKSQLKAQYDELENSKPGLAGGIVLLAVGGVVALNGLVVMLYGIFLPSLFIAGLVIVGVGLPLAAVGIWLLLTRIAERRAIDAELENLQLQIDRAEAPNFVSALTPPQRGVVLARF
jgi:hypothetical protein